MGSKLQINDKYQPLFKSDSRYYVVSGGRGSGKSFSLNLFLLMLTYEVGHVILFTRYTLTSANVSIIPEFLDKHEVAHKDVTELIITNTMHERKSAMYKDTSDFVLLPGGLGSLDETMEVLTWCQLGLLKARVHIFDFDGYWQPMQAMLSHIAEQGFMHSTNLEYVIWAKTADALVDNLFEYD